MQQSLHIKINNYEIELEGSLDFINNYYKKIIDDFQMLKNRELLINKENDKNLLDKEELIDFFRKKSPKTHNDKILIIMYWLLKYQNTKEIEDFNIIINNYEKLRIKKPANIQQHISALEKEEYILKYKDKDKDKSIYNLSLKGEKYVENLGGND